MPRHLGENLASKGFKRGTSVGLILDHAAPPGR
jgi:hypothetical protein